MLSQPMNAIKHYLRGLFSAAFNGGVGALAGILGIDAMAQIQAAQVRQLSPNEMLSAFAGAFVLHGVIWLKKHPLQEEYETLPDKPSQP